LSEQDGKPPEPAWDDAPASPGKPQAPRKAFYEAVGIGTLAGVFVVALPYFFVYLYCSFQTSHDTSDLFPRGPYGISLLLLFPALQGFVFGWRCAKYHLGWYNSGAVLLMLFLDFVLASFVLREGVICLIMASPLLITLLYIGTYIGRFMGDRKGNAGKLHAAALPVLALFAAHDGAVTAPSYANAISDAVTINAPPEIVWHYIVEYPENTSPPEYWLWRIGMPMPQQSVAAAKTVGAARECKFTKGIGFKEKIIELVPAKTLTFSVTEQPQHPEVIGHFQLDKGQLQLERNADGTTTVIATSWYHLFVTPAAYFDWWVTDIVRNVHFRVLNHMKALAEEEAAGTKSGK